MRACFISALSEQVLFYPYCSLLVQNVNVSAASINVALFALCGITVLSDFGFTTSDISTVLRVGTGTTCPRWESYL